MKSENCIVSVYLAARLFAGTCAARHRGNPPRNCCGIDCGQVGWAAVTFNAYRRRDPDRRPDARPFGCVGRDQRSGRPVLTSDQGIHRQQRCRRGRRRRDAFVEAPPRIVFEGLDRHYGLRSSSHRQVSEWGTRTACRGGWGARVQLLADRQGAGGRQPGLDERPRQLDLLGPVHGRDVHRAAVEGSPLQRLSQPGSTRPARTDRRPRPVSRHRGCRRGRIGFSRDGGGAGLDHRALPERRSGRLAGAGAVGIAGDWRGRRRSQPQVERLGGCRVVRRVSRLDRRVGARPWIRPHL